MFDRATNIFFENDKLHFLSKVLLISRLSTVKYALSYVTKVKVNIQLNKCFYFPFLLKISFNSFSYALTLMIRIVEYILYLLLS